MNGYKNISLAALLALSLGAYATEATAAAVKINNCMTITKPGLHVLTKNIDISAVGGDCLIVDQDFVTLDFQGFTIRGNGTGSGITKVFGNFPKGLTIRDGSITTFLNGINISGVTGVTVERMRVTDNEGIGILLGGNGRVTDNIVTGNGDDGINAIPNMIITGNVASFNDDVGILGIGIITGNIAHGNGGMGIFCRSESVCTGNFVTSNDGIGISAQTGTVVTGNSSSFNTGSGITAADGSVVIGNSATSNDVFGIGSDGSTIAYNTANDNGLFGLSVTCPSNIIGNTATDNTGGNLSLNVTAGLCNDIDNIAP